MVKFCSLDKNTVYSHTGTDPFASMGKDMIIKMLQEQLEVANATIRQMESSMRAMEKTIANLEALLKERDTSLAKAQNQHQSSIFLWQIRVIGIHRK